jgi:cytochrome c553
LQALGRIDTRLETAMKIVKVCVLALCIAAAGCTNLPRSRDLGNPDVAGKALAEQVCSNCHGVTGTATSPNFPNLAGQQEEYLVAQLQGFHGQSRRDPAGYEYMWGISRSLTDKQIAELAAYFAAQQLRPQPIENADAQVAAGQVIFEHGIAEKSIPPCGSCHGPEGRGNGKFPRIAGQHSDYLIKQLTVFQRTDERPEGSIMKTVAHELTAENIVNVAAYIQALPHRPGAH